MENRLIKNTILYSVGNFSTKILSFLIVPLYTYYISTADMGWYDVVISAMTFITPVITLQLSDGLYRWLYDESLKKQAVISSGLKRVALNIMIFSIIGILIAKLLDFRYGTVLIFMFVLSMLNAVLLQVTRGLQHNLFYVFVGIIQSIFNLGVSVITIIFFGWGIYGMIIASIISNLIANLLMVFGQKDVIHSLFEKYNPKIASEMMAYSKPLIPNSIGWSVINVSDRFIILAFLGMSANGVYSIAYKFPTILTVIMSFFYMAWQEEALKENNSKERDSYYTKIFKYYIKIMFALEIILLPLTHVYIAQFMEASYIEAWRYTAFLYLGAIFSSLSSFLGVGYLTSKESKGAMYTTFVGTAANIIVNLALINTIGLQAAAFSTFIAYFIMFIIRLRDTRKYFKININWMKLWIFIAGIVVYNLIYLFVDSLMVRQILFSSAIIVGILVNLDLLSLFYYKLKRNN